MKIKNLTLQQREVLFYSHLSDMKFMCDRLIDHYPKDDEQHYNYIILKSVLEQIDRVLKMNIARQSKVSTVTLTDAQAYTLYRFYMRLPIAADSYYEQQLRQLVTDSIHQQMQ